MEKKLIMNQYRITYKIGDSLNVEEFHLYAYNEEDAEKAARKIIKDENVIITVTDEGRLWQR